MKLLSTKKKKGIKEGKKFVDNTKKAKSARKSVIY